MINVRWLEADDGAYTDVTNFHLKDARDSPAWGTP